MKLFYLIIKNNKKPTYLSLHCIVINYNKKVTLFRIKNKLIILFTEYMVS